MKRVVLNGANVGGVGGCTVVIENGLITEISRAVVPGPSEGTIDVGGGAVLPGLWDHHVHLFAGAARAWSIDVTETSSIGQFKDMLTAAIARQRFGVRVVGYDDEMLGQLDGNRLDRIIPTLVPIRVQHRSGHQWVLNAAARQQLKQDEGKLGEDGILWGQNTLEHRSPETSRIRKSVRALAQRIAANGCIGVTDMSATSGVEDLKTLRALLKPLLSVEAYGSPDGGLHAVKRIAPDHRYPDPDEVAAWVNPGHGKVAVHTVTAETMSIIVAAGAALGPHVRLEHAFMANPDLLTALSGTGVELGVHPGFIHSHGDRVLRRFPQDGVADYQRLESMRHAGFRMFGGTDQPYAPWSIWRCMEAAVTRKTKNGAQLGMSEALTPEAAFGLFTTHGLQGEAAPPTVGVGQPADLCVMDRNWKEARSALSEVRVLLTVAAGKPTWFAGSVDQRRSTIRRSNSG